MMSESLDNVGDERASSRCEYKPTIELSGCFFKALEHHMRLRTLRLEVGNFFIVWRCDTSRQYGKNVLSWIVRFYSNSRVASCRFVLKMSHIS